MGALRVPSLGVSLRWKTPSLDWQLLHIKWRRSIGDNIADRTLDEGPRPT